MTIFARKQINSSNITAQHSTAQHQYHEQHTGEVIESSYQNKTKKTIQVSPLQAHEIDKASWCARIKMCT